MILQIIDCMLRSSSSHFFPRLSVFVYRHFMWVFLDLVLSFLRSHFFLSPCSFCFASLLTSTSRQKCHSSIILSLKYFLTGWPRRCFCPALPSRPCFFPAVPHPLRETYGCPSPVTRTSCAQLTHRIHALLPSLVLAGLMRTPPGPS